MFLLTLNQQNNNKILCNANGVTHFYGLICLKLGQKFSLKIEISKFSVTFIYGNYNAFGINFEFGFCLN